MEQYKSVFSGASCELIEKRSKFISYISPVQTEAQANAYLSELKEKYWDATHHVYAYVLRESNKTKASDDGEPHGTAGAPVLNVITNNQLLDVMIVVVRYFGGTLLGTGGLVKAYSQAACLAVQSAEVVTYRRSSVFDLVCSYEQYGKILNALDEFGAKVERSSFLSDVDLSFHVASEHVNALKKKVLEVTCGKLNLKFVDEKFLC